MDAKNKEKSLEEQFRGNKPSLLHKLVPSRRQFWLVLGAILAVGYVWDFFTHDKQMQERNEEVERAKANKKRVIKFYNEQRGIEEDWSNHTGEGHVPQPNEYDSLLKIPQNGNAINIDEVPLDGLSQFTIDKERVTQIVASDKENGLDAVGVGNTAYIIPRTPSA